MVEGVRNELASWQNYHEAAPHLLLHAYLQRMVNGGGKVLTEYGAGRGRVGLFVIWPCLGPDGKRHEQHEAIELKVRGAHDGDPFVGALEQFDGYLDQLGLRTGTLVLFDRRPTAPSIAQRTELTTTTSPTGRTVTVLRA